MNFENIRLNHPNYTKTLDSLNAYIYVNVYVRRPIALKFFYSSFLLIDVLRGDKHVGDRRVVLVLSRSS